MLCGDTRNRSRTRKTPAQVSLAWVLALPEVAVAILGCDDTSQLDKNPGALGRNLSEDQQDRLNCLFPEPAKQTRIYD